MARVVKLNAMVNSRLMRCLLEGGYSYQDLSEESGLSITSIRVYVKYLRREGICYRCGWGETEVFRGRKPELWKLGEGKDAPYPKASNSIRSKRWRQRQKLWEQYRPTQPLEERNDYRR